jgi:hypothetical protein
MKNVILHRSQLLAVVPDEDVFIRPLPDPEWAPHPAQSVEDQNVRYQAWDACRHVIGGASVFGGVCGGCKVYVVIPYRVYNELHQPRRVKTKEEDDQQRFQEEQEAKRKAKRTKAQANRASRLLRYEVIPKCHGGVDYGVEQRVLIRTKTHVLTWRPGRSQYLDRGSGSVYARGEFTIMPYTVMKHVPVCDHIGTSKLGYVCKFQGEGSRDIPAPKDFKMSPKSLAALFHEFEDALGLSAHYLDNSGWTGEKTLVLT